MSEFENNAVVCLCGKQCEFYHVEYVIKSRPNCALIAPGGGYRGAKQSCDNV